MHRTGIDGAGSQRLSSRGIPIQILRRICLELCLAARRAEEIWMALVIGLMLGSRGINRHAADRIDGAMPMMFHDRPLPNFHKPHGGMYHD
jgi:hypothetical protein